MTYVISIYVHILPLHVRVIFIFRHLAVAFNCSDVITEQNFISFFFWYEIENSTFSTTGSWSFCPLGLIDILRFSLDTSAI